MASIAVEQSWHSRVSWGALFAGFFVGFGVWLLLLALGAGIGLASFDPRNASNWQGLGIGFGIWGIICGIVASFVGGFLAARLSATAERTEGMLHGVALWGFMMVVGLWVTSMAIGQAVSGAASVAGGAAQTAGQVAASSPQARQQAQQMGQQAQQQLSQAQQQIRQQAPEVAQTAASVGTAGAWVFFALALLTLVAAAIGGRAGVPRFRRITGQEERAPLPDRPLTPQRV